MARKHLPSFSFVMTTTNGVVEMSDPRTGALSRELSFDLSSLFRAPATSVPSGSNRPADDALMNTIDTRFPGQFAYKASFEKKLRDTHEDDEDEWNETGTIFEPSRLAGQESQQQQPSNAPRPLATPLIPQPLQAQEDALPADRRPRYRPPMFFRILRLLRAWFSELRRVSCAIFGRRV